MKEQLDCACEYCRKHRAVRLVSKVALCAECSAIYHGIRRLMTRAFKAEH